MQSAKHLCYAHITFVFTKKKKKTRSILTLEGGGIRRLCGLICLGWWDSAMVGALVSPRGFSKGELMSWRGRGGDGFRPWAGRSDRSVELCCWVSWLRMGEGSGWAFRSTMKEANEKKKHSAKSTFDLLYSSVILICYNAASAFGSNNPYYYNI